MKHLILLNHLEVIFFICVVSSFSAIASELDCSEMTLSWDPNPNPNSNIEGYVVFYGTESKQYEFRETITGIHTTVTLKNLSPSTNYFAAVSSFDSVGNLSQLSNEICFNAAADFIRVSNKTSSSYQDSVTVAWNPSTSTNLFGYLFYYGLSNGNYTHVASISRSKTSLTLTQLESGREYHCSVVAYNESGIQSRHSNRLVIQVPSAPLAESIAISDSPQQIASVAHALDPEPIIQVKAPLNTDSKQNLTFDTFAIQGFPTGLHLEYKSGKILPVIVAPKGVKVILEATDDPSHSSNWHPVREIQMGKSTGSKLDRNTQGSIQEIILSNIVPAFQIVEWPAAMKAKQGFIRVSMDQDYETLIASKLASLGIQINLLNIAFTGNVERRYCHVPQEDRIIHFDTTSNQIQVHHIPGTIRDIADLMAIHEDSSWTNFSVLNLSETQIKAESSTAGTKLAQK